MLEPRVDGYGSKARVAAILDFAELWALSGKDPSIASLVDYADDNGWLRKMREHYEEIGAGAAEEADDDSDLGSTRETAERRLLNLLDERYTVLGGEYPFELIEGRLVYQGGGDRYLYCLAVAVAHAFSDVISCPDPTVVFPSSVARALRNRQLLAVDVGTCRAPGTGFVGTVSRVAAAVGLQTAVTSGMASTSANDEGVDVVGHLPWDERRPGTWVLLGQVTCAKSDRWEAKLDEVAGARWRRYLNLVTTPIEFLAVPHHVELGHLTYLCEKERGIVLDRLRLVPWLGQLSDQEQGILAAVRATSLVEL